MAGKKEVQTYFGICRCCLSYGYLKNMWKEHTYQGEIEVYGKMLVQCFALTWEPSKNSMAKDTICELCISRLREAGNFKKMVLNSQERLLQLLNSEDGTIVKVEELHEDPTMKAEFIETEGDNDTTGAVKGETEYEDIEYLEDVLGDSDEEGDDDEDDATKEGDDNTNEGNDAENDEEDGGDNNDSDSGSIEFKPRLPIRRKMIQKDDEDENEDEPKRKWPKKLPKSERYKTYKQYTEESLRRCMEEVRSKKLTAADAAHKYNIPQKTIAAKLRGPIAVGTTDTSDMNPFVRLTHLRTNRVSRKPSIINEPSSEELENVLENIKTEKVNVSDDMEIEQNNSNDEVNLEVTNSKRGRRKRRGRKVKRVKHEMRGKNEETEELEERVNNDYTEMFTPEHSRLKKVSEKQHTFTTKISNANESFDNQSLNKKQSTNENDDNDGTDPERAHWKKAIKKQYTMNKEEDIVADSHEGKGVRRSKRIMTNLTIFRAIKYKREDDIYPKKIKKAVENTKTGHGQIGRPPGSSKTEVPNVKNKVIIELKEKKSFKQPLQTETPVKLLLSNNKIKVGNVNENNKISKETQNALISKKTYETTKSLVHEQPKNLSGGSRTAISNISTELKKKTGLKQKHKTVGKNKDEKANLISSEVLKQYFTSSCEETLGNLLSKEGIENTETVHEQPENLPGSSKSEVPNIYYSKGKTIAKQKVKIVERGDAMKIPLKSKDKAGNVISCKELKNIEFYEEIESASLFMNSHENKTFGHEQPENLPGCSKLFNTHHTDTKDTQKETRSNQKTVERESSNKTTTEKIVCTVKLTNPEYKKLCAKKVRAYLSKKLREDSETVPEQPKNMQGTIKTEMKHLNIHSDQKIEKSSVFKNGEREDSTKMPSSSNRHQEENGAAEEKSLSAVEMYKHRHNLKLILKYSNATVFKGYSETGLSCCFCEQHMNAKDLKEHNWEHGEIYDEVIKGDDISELAVYIDVTDLKCWFCESDFFTTDQFLIHLEKKHYKVIYRDVKNYFINFTFESEQFECALCPKQFKQFLLLREHMNEHYNNFVCDICSRPFINKKSMLAHGFRHIRKHYQRNPATSLKYNETIPSSDTNSSLQRVSINENPVQVEQFDPHTSTNEDDEHRRDVKVSVITNTKGRLLPTPSDEIPDLPRMANTADDRMSNSTNIINQRMQSVNDVPTQRRIESMRPVYNTPIQRAMEDRPPLSNMPSQSGYSGLPSSNNTVYPEYPNMQPATPLPYQNMQPDSSMPYQDMVHDNIQLYDEHQDMPYLLPNMPSQGRYQQGLPYETNILYQGGIQGLNVPNFGGHPSSPGYGSFQMQQNMPVPGTSRISNMAVPFQRVPRVKTIPLILIPQKSGMRLQGAITMPQMNNSSFQNEFGMSQQNNQPIVIELATPQMQTANRNMPVNSDFNNIIVMPNNSNNNFVKVCPVNNRSVPQTSNDIQMLLDEFDNNTIMFDNSTSNVESLPVLLNYGNVESTSANLTSNNVGRTLDNTSIVEDVPKKPKIVIESVKTICGPSSSKKTSVSSSSKIIKNVSENSNNTENMPVIIVDNMTVNSVSKNVTKGNQSYELSNANTVENFPENTKKTKSNVFKISPVELISIDAKSSNVGTKRNGETEPKRSISNIDAKPKGSTSSIETRQGNEISFIKIMPKDPSHIQAKPVCNKARRGRPPGRFSAKNTPRRRSSSADNKPGSSTSGVEAIPGCSTSNFEAMPGCSSSYVEASPGSSNAPVESTSENASAMKTLLASETVTQATTSTDKDESENTANENTDNEESGDNNNERLFVKKTRIPNKALMEKHRHNLKMILKFSNATMFGAPVNGNQYSCCFCDKSFVPLYLRKHTLQHGDVIDYAVRVRNVSDLVINIDITELKCKLCGEPMDCLEAFLDHLRGEHKKHINVGLENRFIPYKFDDERLQCAVCPKQFRFFMLLREHMAEHYGNYECTACHRPFIDMPSLEVHLKKHDIKEYKNPEEKFTHIINYTYYEKFQNNSKTKKCRYCHDKLATWDALKEHELNVHDVDIPIFGCEECDKRYDSVDGLRTHMARDHYGSTPFKCTQCAAGFFTRSELLAHAALHEKSKLDQCYFCNSKFRSKKALNQHMIVHFGNSLQSNFFESKEDNTN